jgi:23S rRNA pseudouridine2457 synthase
MVAAVNHKCIRLIRTSIEDIHIGSMQPGEVIEFNENDFFRLLKLNA